MFRLMNLNLLPIMAILISACASPAPPAQVRAPEMAMIYGNVNIINDEVVLVELREFGKVYIPPFVIPPRVMVFKNGNFLAENLPAGNYYIARFKSKKTEYTLVNDEQTAYQWIIRLKPGETQYVGSYQITNIEPGLFGRGQFDFRAVQHPTERKILKHMYDLTENTGWQMRISQRLKELR